MSSLSIHDSEMLRTIERALREDIGAGDITTKSIVAPEKIGHGDFIAKANGVLAGLDVAETVLNLVDESLRMRKHLHDGMPVMRGMKIARVTGKIASMLTAERVALNFMQRMSGIATMTSAFVKLVEETSAKIVDTRKTVPGLRAFDKWAVRSGRGENHRFGLDDMVLIKDNHIAAAGTIENAVSSVLMKLPIERKTKIEVECQSLQQVSDALQCEGIDMIMLDNFLNDDMCTAVRMIRALRPHVKIEASGNVNELTVRDIAETGVDMISIGALTHSVKALDISFEVGESISTESSF